MTINLAQYAVMEAFVSLETCVECLKDVPDVAQTIQSTKICYALSLHFFSIYNYLEAQEQIDANILQSHLQFSVRGAHQQ